MDRSSRHFASRVVCQKVAWSFFGGWAGPTFPLGFLLTLSLCELTAVEMMKGKVKVAFCTPHAIEK